MSIKPEEYVALNQPESENPSSASYIQRKCGRLKTKIKRTGLFVCKILLLLLKMSEFVTGLTMVEDCSMNEYIPAYFIIAGLIGSGTLLSSLIIRPTKRCPKIHQLAYPFYAFMLLWLLAGTYYFVIADKNVCLKTAHNKAFWLIISNYICLQICMLAFLWCISTIFVLIYFKNGIIMHIIKAVDFEN